LWRANVAQLSSAGLASESIHEARLCTAHHPDLCHSYRRDGAAAGRMVAAIQLRPASAPAIGR
jgi:copper oxidase (laccase) domain-containing protein